MDSSPNPSHANDNYQPETSAPDNPPAEQVDPASSDISAEQPATLSSTFNPEPITPTPDFQAARSVVPPSAEQPAANPTAETAPNLPMSSTEDVAPHIVVGSMPENQSLPAEPAAPVNEALGDSRSPLTTAASPSQTSPADPSSASAPSVYPMGTTDGTVPPTTSNASAPVGPPPKRWFKKRWFMATAAAIVILVGGAAAYYFGYYTNPSVVLAQSLSNTGNGYNKLVDYFNTQSQIHYKGYTGSGSYSLKASGLSADGNFSFNAGNGASDTSLNLGFGSTQLKAEVLTIKPASGSSTPNIFLKASGINSLGSLLGSTGLSNTLNQYDGKWLEVDQSLLQNIPVASSLDSSSLPTEPQIVDGLKAFGRVNQQYVFTTNSKNAIATVVKKNGIETVDGHKAYHYKMALVKDNVKKYISAEQSALGSSKLETWIKQNNLQGDVDSAFTSMQNSANSINSKDTFDLWADINTRLIYKVRVNDDTAQNPAANYADFGIDYKGGASYPLFMAIHSTDSGSTTNMKLVLTLDSKTNSVGLKANVDGTGASSGNFSADFTFKPTNNVPAITAPAGAVPLSQVLNQLGLGSVLTSAAGNPNTGGSASDQDAKRQSDIQALQVQLETYFAQNGNYPSLGQLNSAAWRQANMSSLDPSALEDPAGNSTSLVATPTAHMYSYAVTNASGGSCESDATQCAKYTITAILSNGQAYSRQNLD